MRPPWRRQRLPEEVRAAVSLRPGERVLGAAHSEGDVYLVASDRALYVVTRTEPRRVRWDLIDRALWEPPLLALEVRADPQARPVREVFPVDQTGELPAVVRDRVTNSIVVNSRIEVTGGHARVVARRNPDDGLLQWRVVLSDGVDPADPAVRAAADAELAELRSRLGV